MRPRPWTVLPHDRIQKLEPDLWAVSGAMPRMGGLDRRMTVVRLESGDLLFHNAIPLDAPSMAQLEAFGRPAFLVVPNGFHRLDVHAWRERYPRLVVVCPPQARARVAQAVQVDGGFERLPADPRLSAVPLQGLRSGEAALVARSADGARASLLFGDAVMNIPRDAGAVLRLMRSAGGPKVTPLFRLLALSDAGALASHLERLAETPGLVRLVPSHGEVIEGDAGAVLRAVAARLR
jgi:hypothetical protein